MARAPEAHRLLSRGNDISAWLNDRHVDPLAHLTGAGRRLAGQNEAVLLLGPKHKLDELMGSLRPFGVTPPALLGVKYVNTHHEILDRTGSFIEHPFIYACSDPAVAADLLRDPPAHVARWNVIVDGARLGRSLYAIAAATPGLAEIPVCVLAELYDREGTADLMRLGLAEVWYLEDQDVEVPLHVAPRATGDILQRMLARRSAHWSSTHAVHGIEDQFLEAVAECLRDRGRNSARSGGAAFLDLAVSMFLQKALSCALPMADIAAELRLVGQSISAQASVLRQFDKTADRLYQLFRNFDDPSPLLEARRQTISKIIGSIDAGQSVAVVCRSAHIAEKCRAASVDDAALARVEWLNIEALRRQAPYDRIIVPAWLDRLAMRELALNGYAPRLDFALLPFERRWFEGTTTAIRKWERQLEGRTVQRLTAAAQTIDTSGGLAARWRSQTELRLASSPIVGANDPDLEDDEPDSDLLEARAVEALARAAAAQGQGNLTARAQLVLFESGSYALLPPSGKAIVLSEAATADEARKSENAERILMRNVAELRPGMVLAFSLGGDRDLIDARADQFLADAGSIRRQASLWKTALRRTLRNDDERIAELSKRMAMAGQSRDPGTIRFWLHYGQTIAPRNFRVVIPLLAELTADVELRGQLKATLQAVDLVYRARARAAEAIVDQLFSGEIDITQPSLSFIVGEKEVSYVLHRVRRMGEVQTVPADLIGKVRTFTEVSGAAA